MRRTLFAFRQTVKGAYLLLVIVVASGPAFSEPWPGDPKPDINIVGPTRDPADIRDEGLKQQNEPACAMRPGDGDCIICFYNDYRTVDIFEHQDAWIGMSESCDAGDTWYSRIVPGHPTHLAPIGTKFAADPRAIALPGVTIHGFIGGFRDQDRGVLAVQHWLENNQEDGDYNEPTLSTTIVDEGTEGRFIDKPEFHFKESDEDPQPKVRLLFDMENPELGTIERTFPAGTLYAAYAVFTGSQSVKLLVKRSYDLGQTWTNQVKKLTESQNLVSGITMTSLGNITMAMWRQVRDTNDKDAIYFAITKNGGNTWTKPTLLREICRFDQPSATQISPVALSTFRTNDFPWLANDGKNIYAFFTERVGGCETGTPKVFMQYTSNGNSWFPNQPMAVDQSAESATGAQLMPAAFGARGKVQVAWYDTRRENFPFEPELPFVADYIPTTGMLINRKVDVYTARITSDQNGNNVQISESVRVSQPRTIRDRIVPGPPLEIEASFANAKMYASGFLAFLGDYFAVTAQEFREDGAGGWEENQSPVPGDSNRTNFFIAYADNRDVRGDVLFDGSGSQNQYTPPDNVPATGSGTFSPKEEDESVLFAESGETPSTRENKRRSTEGIEDIFVDPATLCKPEKDRTRDANIYGALIRDRLRLSSPVESRPLSGILRAIPFIAKDVSSDPPPPPPAVAPPTQYRVYIATQPGPDFQVNRASFRQKPYIGPFSSAPPLVDLVEDIEVERNSAVARTVFMVSPDIDATVEVRIYDGACAKATDDENGPTLAFTTACDVLGSISLGGGGTAGPLQQPDYLAQQCASEADCDVSVTELHNPIIENPIIENPIIENPIIENVELSAMELENPIIENPIIENYGYENPIIENPIIENYGYENPIIENPIIENPIIENTAYADGDLTYADMTTAVRNDGNVYTAYNVDQTVANFTSTGGGDPVSQLIIWKQYVTGTSRNCEYRPEGRYQVVTTVNQPDDTLELTTVEDPFAGEASFILAPGEQGYITYRLFGTTEELAPVRLSGLTVAAQAANCDENDDTVGPGTGENEYNFYECFNQIEDLRERFLFEADSEPPVFVPPPDPGATVPDDPVDANAPGGACVSQAFLGSLFTVTDNESTTIDISCSNAQGDQICIDANTNDGSLSAPVGTSDMTCTATDEIGNFASISVKLAVEDPDAPFFTSVVDEKTATVPPDGNTAIVDLDEGFAGEDVFGVDPNPVIACTTDTGLSGDAPIPIGIGDYSVTCTITDASGNSDPNENRAYPLYVLDKTAPTFTSVQPDIPADAGSNGTATVSFDTPTATDNSGVPPLVSCIPASGSVFDVGTTAVTCTATDGSNNSSQTSFNVIVADNTAPIIALNGASPLPLQVGDTYVELGAVATDNVDGPVAVSIAGTVNTGTPDTYFVTYSASDAAGNSVSVTRTVIVSDTTAPTISNVPGTITAEATSGAGAEVTYTTPTATDLSSAGATISCTPASGSIFPLGTTTVVCTASDTSDNSAQETFDVVVQDTTAPTLSVSPNPFEAYTYGTPQVSVDFSGAISVDDAVSEATYICTPESGSLFSGGETEVSCTASDASGNSSDAIFTVRVKYPQGAGIFANKYQVKAASSNPLSWAWQDEYGNNIDSSGDMQHLSIIDCDDPTTVVLQTAGDPGSSGFRIKSDNSWEFNWQTDYLPEMGGGPLDPGDYCPSVRSGLTGDELFITPRPVTVR